MHDNKIRLSTDVLEKAEMIASEWGLKNARAAVEAVFRRYADDYLHGRGLMNPAPSTVDLKVLTMPQPKGDRWQSEALSALDELLG